MRFPHLISLAATLALAAASSDLTTTSATTTDTDTTTLTSTEVVASSSVGVIEFDNVGYIGYYYDVKSISNADSTDCLCELSTAFTVFTGANSPLNEEISVHFRGPLTLSQFAWYVANDSSTGTWERHAYYNATSQTADNVTFLNNGGAALDCMGDALCYSPANGTGYATESHILEASNYIESDQEYAIFSNVSCPSSGFDNSCGVYRDDIPAYHGFAGTTKLFLFEFTMPEESSDQTDKTYPNMPAIWFLNAKIPRTGQYASDGNCSCWNSGCGEMDAFEVTNKTYPLRLSSTLHDYQGTGLINEGISTSAYLTRSYTSTMKGAARFGTDGTVAIFLLDDIVFDDEIDTSSVSNWVSDAGTENVKTLSTITMDTTVTSSTSTATGSGSGSGSGTDSGSDSTTLGGLSTKASDGAAVGSSWVASLFMVLGLALAYL